VVETDHEHGSTENVGEKDELLALLIGHVSDLREELDPVPTTRVPTTRRR
jgi:hypothetical protein